jgi:hypothetical protein
MDAVEYAKAFGNDNFKVIFHPVLWIPGSLIGSTGTKSVYG